MRHTALVLCVLLLAPLVAQERPLPDYDSFTARVKTRLATDEERQSGYMFIEKQTEQKLDGTGRIKDESVKVFEVYPGLPGEDRYRRLIEERGNPVPRQTLEQHDRERQKEVESYTRKISTSAQRQKETERREKERQRYAAAIDDLFRIYDIRLVKRESLGGHDTIVATITPKAGVKARTDEGNVMRHFKGRAWVSETDHEVVRIEIEAVDNLSFGWGLLARVHKGATATYQRRKVNNETWLPEKVTWTGSARVLLLKSLRLRGISEYSGYRKFTVDTSSTYLASPQ